MSKIKLNSGIFFDFDNPTLDQINIHDVAHNLSKEQRFCNCFGVDWSVLQHVLLCYHIGVWENMDDETNYILLHHDDPEYVLKDIPTPLKNMLRDYKKIYSRVEIKIAEKFEVDIHVSNATVKEIDKLSASIEDVVFSSDDDYSWHDFNEDRLYELDKVYNQELIAMIHILAGYNQQDQQMMYLRIHKKLADKLNKPEVIL